MTKEEAPELAKKINDHPGQWVLVKGVEVVATGRTLKAAVKRVSPEDREGVCVYHPPAKDAPEIIFAQL